MVRIIKHIVFWKIKPDIDIELTHMEFKEKIAYLRTIIPQIKEADVGLNHNEDNDFHICIDSVFENDSDLQIYINHAEHLKVREFLNERTFEKAVFDYELNI